MYACCTSDVYCIPASKYYVKILILIRHYKQSMSASFTRIHKQTMLHYTRTDAFRCTSVKECKPILSRRRYHWLKHNLSFNHEAGCISLFLYSLLGSNLHCVTINRLHVVQSGIWIDHLSKFALRESRLDKIFNFRPERPCKLVRAPLLFSLWNGMIPP
jgi:hypothetical protein